MSKIIDLRAHGMTTEEARYLTVKQYSRKDEHELALTVMAAVLIVVAPIVLMLLPRHAKAEDMFHLTYEVIDNCDLIGPTSVIDQDYPGQTNVMCPPHESVLEKFNNVVFETLL
jgi:hypothetical protein